MLKNAIVVCGGVALGLVASKYLKPKRSPHTPIVLVVTVEIAKERLEAFRAAMEIDAAGSRLEPGCLRFDLLEDAENPLKFTFYEARAQAYVDAAAIDFHKTQPHYKAWADFKAAGGVLSQTVAKSKGVDFTA